MPAAAKSKPKSVRKRSKHRMSVDYPRDVENVAPAATFKAKATPRLPRPNQSQSVYTEHTSCLLIIAVKD